MLSASITDSDAPHRKPILSSPDRHVFTIRIDDPTASAPCPALGSEQILQIYQKVCHSRSPILCHRATCHSTRTDTRTMYFLTSLFGLIATSAAVLVVSAQDPYNITSDPCARSCLELYGSTMIKELCYPAGGFECVIRPSHVSYSLPCDLRLTSSHLAGPALAPPSARSNFGAPCE